MRKVLLSFALLLALAMPAAAKPYLDLTPEVLAAVMEAGLKDYKVKTINKDGQLVWAIRKNKELVAALFAEENGGHITRLQVVTVQWLDYGTEEERREVATIGGKMLLCAGMAMTGGDIQETSRILTPLKERLDKEKGGVAMEHKRALYALLGESMAEQGKSGLVLIIVPASPIDVGD